MKVHYFLAALLCITHSALATEAWLTIPNSDSNIMFAIDQGSIERQGEIVRFWEKLVYIQPKVVDEASGKWVKEKKVHRLMHCADRTQGVISGATYSENGRFISSVSFDAPQSEMSAIPPGTLAAAELELVCKMSAKP